MPTEAHDQIPGRQQFVISRTFDAPREAVFAAWTEIDKLAQWWGPAGLKIDVMRLEVWPGGMFHYRMTVRTGEEFWGRFVYHQIEAPEKLVFINAFSNASGGLERHFMSPTWPREVRNVWTFEADGDRTILTGKGLPINATEEEHYTFVAGFPAMEAGFAGALDQLDAVLKKTEAPVTAEE
jgi:uncharacterized protein YndB with AHSA1/START domain